ncbi:DUF1588 domain-containing protein [bacterium]|nr:DUF1588 domain-containing protein [bacterium]
MQNRLQIFVAALIAFLAQQTHAQDQTVNESLNLKENLQPFIKSYCMDCHGTDAQEGQVRFDQVSWQIDNNDTAQRWQDVLDQLNGGDMPPREAKQPSNGELAAVLEQLTKTLFKARRRLTDNGGEIRMRRLNKREYSNTIRSLFGFDVALDDIPDDGEIETFDTVGTEQYFTSMHLEAYLELGNRIAAEALKFNTQRRRDSKISHTEPETRVNKNMRKKLADLDKKMAMKKAGKTWKEMGFKDEGEMEIIFRQWDSRAELPRRYLQYPLVESGVYNCDVAKWVSISQHIDIRGDYLIRIHGGVVGEPHELRSIVRLWDKNRIRGTLKLTGTTQKPATVSMTARQPMGRFQLGANIRENVPENTINAMRGYVNKLEGSGERTDPRAAIWIDWLEIEGPFYPEQRPDFEKILYPNTETGGKSELLRRDDKALELIKQFAFEAFRHHTPEPDYLNELHKLFQSNRKKGLSYNEAITEVMGIIMASPGFLFLQEDSGERNQATGTSPTSAKRSKSNTRLKNRELAIRLAYFLWSSPPDDELYAADLSNETVYGVQVDRMLDDPRAKAFRDGFISQWAELDRYDAITVDKREHFHFNEGVQQDAKQEVREFFGVLIDENLPASNLIDSDFVVINSALAVHYGIDLPPTDNAEFQKVQLPPDSPRGGLLTQTAFLTAGSNGERSSPVIRGALVMEKLLHDKPAPPPPNVPELGAASKQPKTNREMVKLHQQQKVCSSCHRKMDAIGFGLENFDTIGRWRATEKVGRKSVAINPSSTLPDGSSFSTVQELKSVLLQHEDRLAEELVESMLGYALGRTIEFSDSDDVAAILSKLKTKSYGARSMIREIALSQLFRSRG